METKYFVRTNVAGVFLALVAVLFFTSCKPNTSAEISAVASKENLPNLVVKQLESIISDSGLVTFRVETAELLQFDNLSEPYSEFPLGIHITSLDKELKMNAEIKGNYAKYLKKKQLWLLRNDVKATNYEGNVINTEELYWDMGAHKLYSDKFIKITSDKEILTGVGFESNEDFTKYRILKINGILNLQE